MRSFYRNRLALGSIPQLPTGIFPYQQKTINLIGQTGAGTNYQVPLLVGESSGAVGANFDLGGLADSFPTGKNVSGDLRFYGSANDLLPFWVESVSGSAPNRVAKIWVKVSDDLGTNKTIYLRYKTGVATNVSSGDNTFILFDDFDDASIDSNKWLVSSGGGGDSVTESGDSLTIVSDNSSPMKTVQSKNAITGDIEILSRSSITTMTNGHNLGIMLMDSNQADGNGAVAFYAYNVFNFYNRSTGTWSSVATSQGSFSFSTNYLLKLKSVGSTISFFKDGSQLGSSWTKALGTNRYLSIPRVWNEAAADTGTFLHDWIAVKKALATDPSFGWVVLDSTFTDDFNGSSINATNWNVVRGAGQISVSGGLMTLTGTSNGSTCPEAQTTAAVPKINRGMYAEFRAQIYSTSQSGYQWGFNDGTNMYGFGYAWDVSQGYLLTQAGNNGTRTSYGSSGQYRSAQQVYRIEYLTDGTINIKLNGSTIRTSSSTATNLTLNSGMYCYDSGTSHVFDYIKIGNL